MAKFNISTVQPGQVDEAAKTIVETPTEQVQERVPQANAFEALLAGEPTDVDAAAQEITTEADVDPDIAAQQERERVKPLGERFKEATIGSTKWKTATQSKSEVNDTNSGIENVRARSRNMIKLVEDKKLSGGWGLSSALKHEGKAVKEIFKAEGQEKGVEALQVAAANKPSAILQKAGAAEITETGTQIDPNFIATLSAVTENFMMGAQVATEGGAPKEKVDEFTGEPTGDLERPQSDYEISKAQGNSRLGTDIHREYQRIKNAQAGRPTDQYNDLTPVEATVLGDLAKELFYEANPDLIQRIQGSKEEPVRFIVTAKGVDVLSKSNEARKRLFPTENVRPSKSVLPKGTFVGEGAKLTSKRTTKAGKLGDTRLIDQAMENLHSIPNVVDPRRSRVLLATAIPAMKLAMQGNYEGTWSNIVGIGVDQQNNFIAAKEINDRKNEKARIDAEDKGKPFFPTPYDVRKNMDNEVDKLAQSIRSIAQERNGANYLTYAMQSFTGRVHPQQTYFDPTASKIVRFATRNATPVKITKGSRADQNITQMYAMMFIGDASEALPAERRRLLNVHGPKLYEMGATIEAALRSTDIS